MAEEEAVPGEWLGVGVSEVRGGWGTEDGPLEPGSAVRVALPGTPVGVDDDGPLAVRGADNRLIVCGLADVQPGEVVVGRVVLVQPPSFVPKRLVDD